ncbi:unnamed protein product [Rhizoctonia solani]|uniref:Complex 1 LYR protein domain-containing protein n=1 Tax=Rhizoctonia solani TaxID=456999 RepID=A0A8H3AGS6_9AGAM|nr:unnamed protein product [Rhizoctonia solani]
MTGPIQRGDSFQDVKPSDTGIYITADRRVCTCLVTTATDTIHHTPTDTAMRLSGLQKEVLGLYRRALRMARSKPASSRGNFNILVQYEFRVRGAVSPRDVGTIEYLVRRGKKRLEMLEDPGVKECWVSGEMREWWDKAK